MLIQSNDHHDINNIVGPWIMARDNPDQNKPVSLAFRNRLAWMSLLPKSESSFELAGETLRPDTRREPFDIVVIDDQLNHGWHKVLCSKLIGLDPNLAKPADGGSISKIATNEVINLLGSTSPKALSQFLIPKDENDTRKALARPI